MSTRMKNSTVIKEEIDKFSRMSEEWWDPNGKFKPLHKFNPIRVKYIIDNTLSHFKINKKSDPLNGLNILDVGCGGGLLTEPLSRLGANGTGFIECLAAFEADPQTAAIVMIGEIGGTAEEDAAAWAAENVTKPIVGFVAGATAPPGKRMGHAGAIISGGKGTAEEKFAAFEAAGIACAKDPSELGSVLLESLKKAGLR